MFVDGMRVTHCNRCGAVSAWFAGRSAALKVKSGVGALSTVEGNVAAARGAETKVTGRDNLELRPARTSVLVERSPPASKNLVPVVARNAADGWAYDVEVDWSCRELAPEMANRPKVWTNQRSGSVGNLSTGQPLEIGNG